MGQYLSKQRTAQALGELFDTPISHGTVSSATARAAGNFEGFTSAVTKRIATAEVAHFDETGFRAAGKLHWLHSASTSLWTLITCHPRRGREAMNAAGVLPHFTGIAVHDAWAPYDTYPQLTHSLCNAHVLRELIAVTDHHRTHAADPDSWCWAGQVIENLLALKKLTGTGPVPVDPERLAHHRSLILHAVRIGIIDSPPGKVGNKHRALARRITIRIEDYLRFATDPHAPFDNNAAEREIRMAKLRQKISGGMRTLTGAEQFAALRSYIATTAKTGSTDWTHSPDSPPANPGSQPPPDQLRTDKVESVDSIIDSGGWLPLTLRAGGRPPAGIFTWPLTDKHVCCFTHGPRVN